MSDYRPIPAMTAPRILVTDVEHPSCLAAIRCLSDSGYLVTAGASTVLAPGLWSRACAVRSSMPAPSRDADGFVRALVALLRRRRHHALIPGTDASLLVVSRRREMLEPQVALGLPSHHVVERALDRRFLLTNAAAAGIATPEEHVCTEIGTAVSAAREFGFPVLVKPVHVVTGPDLRPVRHASRLAPDEQTLRRVAQRMDACIVQRRVPGDVVSIGGVFNERRLLGAVMARNHRVWPPQAGVASFVESITPDRRLLERVEAFLQAADWRGLWQLQFIEGQDGVLHAIDFNPRPYASMGLAAAAGAPLTSQWCASLLGHRQTLKIARPGVRWKAEDDEARHILCRLRHRQWRDALGVAAARADTHAYFDRGDPLPLLARAAQLQRDLWLRLSRRSASALASPRRAKREELARSEPARQ